MKWHPDKNPNNVAEAEKKFKAVSEAYVILERGCKDYGSVAAYKAQCQPANPFASQTAGGAGRNPGNFNTGHSGFYNDPFADDIFGAFFGMPQTGGGQRRQSRDPFMDFFENFERQYREEMARFKARGDALAREQKEREARWARADKEREEHLNQLRQQQDRLAREQKEREVRQKKEQQEREARWARQQNNSGLGDNDSPDSDTPAHNDAQIETQNSSAFLYAGGMFALVGSIVFFKKYKERKKLLQELDLLYQKSYGQFGCKLSGPLWKETVQSLCFDKEFILKEMLAQKLITSVA